MTRRRLQRILFQISAVFIAILVFALYCKLSGDADLLLIYEYINDMSLIMVTIIAVYLTSVFQKRGNFLKSLREEWRDIVDTKAVLLAYCSHARTTHDDYIIAFRKLSRTVDYMRIVYKNVGETDTVIGKYPYTPLHDMLTVMKNLNPRDFPDTGMGEKQEAKKQIIALFDAMREHFLDEFDLDEPSNPLLAHNARRQKLPGTQKVSR